MTFSRTTPFLVGFTAAIAGLSSAPWIGWTSAVTISANALFVIYIALTLANLHHMNQQYLARHRTKSFVPISLMFLITLLTVAAAMVSLFIAINGHQGLSPLQYGLALISVPLGWFTIHLMAANHYAHMFWEPPAGSDTPRKGLQFPDTPDPHGWDFVYFAVVIGMTAQTSDVAITGAHMRRFNLLHAIVAFFFNTVLVAAAVNVAVSLGN